MELMELMELVVVDKEERKEQYEVGSSWLRLEVGWSSGIALSVVVACWAGAACRYWRFKVISSKVLC